MEANTKESKLIACTEQGDGLDDLPLAPSNSDIL